MAGTKSTIDAQGQASDDAGVMLKMKDTKIRILEDQVNAEARHEMSVRLRLCRCHQQILEIDLPLFCRTKASSGIRQLLNQRRFWYLCTGHNDDVLTLCFLSCTLPQMVTNAKAAGEEIAALHMRLMEMEFQRDL